MASQECRPQTYPVASLVRDYPDEFSVNGDETDYEKLLKVADESRLPGGSLHAVRGAAVQGDPGRAP